jgi:hypothetical protein
MNERPVLRPCHGSPVACHSGCDCPGVGLRAGDYLCSQERAPKGPQLGWIRLAAIMVVVMMSPPAAGRSLLHIYRSERNQRRQDQDRSHHTTLPSLMPPKHITTVRVTWPTPLCGLIPDSFEPRGDAIGVAQSMRHGAASKPILDPPLRDADRLEHWKCHTAGLKSERWPASRRNTQPD